MSDFTDTEIWIAALFAFAVGYVLVSFLARLMKTEPLTARPKSMDTIPPRAEQQLTSDDEAKYAHILGAETITSAAELELAYRDALAKSHPDKFVDLADEFKRLALQRTKEIEEAYGFLKQRRNI